LNFLFIKNPTRQQKGMFVFWVFLGGKGLFEGFEGFDCLKGLKGLGCLKGLKGLKGLKSFDCWIEKSWGIKKTCRV
jgi:hypothetical protein